MAQTRDTRLLFTARSIRLFAYGFLSIIFVLYLVRIGMGGPAIGLLLALTLLGDAGISLWITTRADRMGRRRMLLLGAALMAAGGIAFLLTRRPELLMLAAIVGVISPSGHEIGPFLSIEQAALSQLVSDRERTRVFAWYNLAGSVATALGALAGGWLTHFAQQRGVSDLDSYRVLLACYAAVGVMLAALFTLLSPAVEIPPAEPRPARSSRLGLHRSGGVVARLGALFALDAFAGGFVLQSVMAYWFHVRFGASTAAVGSLFFGANLLAAVSALLAHRIAARIGLVNTMVATHLPSNVMLVLVPLMPSMASAMGLLLARYAISQMDVPTRQSYTMAVVAPDERAAAAGVTAIARSLGAGVAPVIGGAFLLTGSGAPFFVAGGLKILYDLLLYRAFRRMPAPTDPDPS
ncbi:MAG TPA: MFS transporter [Candidatus Eisenbacteria bacterium]|jgi:MFS family permease